MCSVLVADAAAMPAGSAVRLHRSVNAGHGSIYRKALRRTMRWVRDCSTAASVSHQQLLATAAIQPPRNPLPRPGLRAGLLLERPLCMLSAPLRFLAAAACAVRRAPPARGCQYTALPLEVRPATPRAGTGRYPPCHAPNATLQAPSRE